MYMFVVVNLQLKIRKKYIAIILHYIANVMCIEPNGLEYGSFNISRVK